MEYNFKRGDKVIYVGCTEACRGLLDHPGSSETHLKKIFTIKSLNNNRVLVEENSSLIPYATHLKLYNEFSINGIDLSGP